MILRPERLLMTFASPLASSQNGQIHPGQSTKTDGFKEFLQKLSEISNMSDEAVEQIEQHRMVCFGPQMHSAKRQMKA
jgi:hypothetical protein